MALSMRINGGFKVGTEQAWYHLQMLVTQKGDSIYVKNLILHNKVMMAMFWIWRLCNLRHLHQSLWLAMTIRTKGGDLDGLVIEM